MTVSDAPEIEITSIPALTPGEHSLLEMHSLLNIVNVLHGELTLIGLHIANDPELLRESLTRCERTAGLFQDPAAALEFARGVGNDQKAIWSEIATVIGARSLSLTRDQELKESLDNLRAVFGVLEARVQETLTRTQAPDRWLDWPIDEFRADFQAVFAAIEKNSRGRYRIIYNLARQLPQDYYLDFEIESANGCSLSCPLLFKNVMRDLIANARKYTAPGGSINVGVYETEEELRFVVQDTGCGIPTGELEAVVAFGRRGSNVGGIRTMGGGFGLTKAFVVTRHFGGRMWVKSALGLGTRIAITLPRQPGVVVCAALECAIRTDITIRAKPVEICGLPPLPQKQRCGKDGAPSEKRPQVLRLRWAQKTRLTPLRMT